MRDSVQPKYRVYRMLGFFNVFVSVLFLFVIVLNLLVAGFDPRIILLFFIAFSFLAYSNLTTVFANQVLVNKKTLTHRFKDWIKVNSIVTLVCAGIAAVIFVITLFSWNEVEKYIKENNIPVPELYFLSVLIFLTFAFILLVLHALFTFKYLRLFKEHFQ